MWPMTKPTRMEPVTAITAFFPIEVSQTGVVLIYVRIVVRRRGTARRTAGLEECYRAYAFMPSW